MPNYPPSLPPALLPYLTRGVSLFPVRGKRPCTRNGFKDASRDLEQWTRWAEEFPGCGWAAPTGESNGFDVLDADTLEAVAEGEARLPPGPRVRTGGGGMHFYVRHVPGARNWAKRRPGFDYRAEGGYVVLAGSIHESGQPYEWVEGTADLPLPDAPEWLSELQRAAASRPASGARYVEGERNDRLFRIASAVRAKGGDVLDEVRLSNEELCLPPLGDKEVQRIVESASRYSAGRAPHSKSKSPAPKDKDQARRTESYVELTDGRIVEEILTHNGPAFLIFTPNPECWEIAPLVWVDGEEVRPRPVPVGLRESLLLADGVEEYGTTRQLLAELEAWGLEAYDPGKEGPIFRLWVRLALASWLLDAFYRGAGDRYAPVLPSVGPPESGKGRLLLVARYMSYRSLYLLKTTRVPSIFRALQGWNGTLILDEADLASSTEASEFIEFLNARAYGVPILRYNTDGDRMSYFQSFGMTILAIRKAYEDAGFNSRTVPMHAVVTTKVSDIDLVAARAWIDRGRALLRKLLLWRLRHIHLILTGKLRLPTRVAFPKVEAFRVRAAVLPLLALKEEEPEIVRDLGDLVAEIQTRLVTERADSPEGVLLGFVHDRLGAEGFEVVREEPGFKIEETRVERTADEGPITYNVPLTARGVSEALGRELPIRTVSRIWRAMGQSVKPRARYPEKLYASLLVISDPQRLEREFSRFVPNAQPKADLFRARPIQSTLADSATQDLPEQAEHPEQTNREAPNPGLAVQPVQDVQAASIRPGVPPDANGNGGVGA
jgi:hypothetical protein